MGRIVADIRPDAKKQQHKGKCNSEFKAGEHDHTALYKVPMSPYSQGSPDHLIVEKIIEKWRR